MVRRRAADLCLKIMHVLPAQACGVGPVENLPSVAVRAGRLRPRDGVLRQAVEGLSSMSRPENSSKSRSRVLYPFGKHDPHTVHAPVIAACDRVGGGLLTSRSVTRRPIVVPNVPRSTGSVPDIETSWI